MADKCEKCGGRKTKSGWFFCVMCGKRLCGFCQMGSQRGTVCGDECLEKARQDAPPSKAFGVLAILLLAVLFVPRADAAERNKPSRHWLTKAAITMRLADIATTKIALTRPGTYEANPLFGREPSMQRMVLTELALGVALYGVSKGITELGHPEIAKGLVIGSTVGEGLVSIHNATVKGHPNVR